MFLKISGRQLPGYPLLLVPGLLVFIFFIKQYYVGVTQFVICGSALDVYADISTGSIKHIGRHCLVLTMVNNKRIFCFFLQALLIDRLVNFSQLPSPTIGYGVGLCAGLMATEFGRSLFFSLMWAINYRYKSIIIDTRARNQTKILGDKIHF